MRPHPTIEKALARLERGDLTRIVGFGSSNTEARALFRFNWLDWFDAGLRGCFGRCHRTINSGVSGDTTGRMLERFGDDVARYEPHLVLVTGGGNDSAPAKTRGEDAFRANLTEIVTRTRKLGAAVVLQTYYAVDLERMEADYAAAWPRYMEVIRQVSADTGTALLDHYSRWEPLRRSDVALYRTLMHDPLHVNPLGNMIMGMDLLRLFGVPLTDELAAECAEGLEVQRRLDSLAASG